MYIAFYLGHYPSPGGTTTAVSGLAGGLAKQGHRVEILGRGTYERALELDGITALTFKPELPAIRPLPPRKLIDHLQAKSSAIDLLVLNGLFNTELPAIATFARKNGIPYLIAPHDPLHPALFAHGRWRKQLYWNLVERKMFKHATGIQVLASAHRKHLEARGLRSNVLVIPNGVGVAAPSRSKDHRETSDKPTLGYLGRVDSWHKGLDILLDAFSAIYARHPDLRLRLAGRDWGDRGRLETQAASLGLKDQVAFVGEVEEASTELSKLDALVLPSRFDGFGMVVLEAMLAGLPVLCSSEAGISAHVQMSGCGVVVHPARDDLAQGIDLLLARRAEWSTMGCAGRRYALATLDWNTIATSAARQYQDVIGYT